MIRRAFSIRPRVVRVACLAALHVLLARGATAGQHQYLLDVWDTERGLPSSAVTALAETPEGYLWIGTQNGLVRFDGVRFETFDPANTATLRHARVENLAVDALGRLWINTFDGSLTSWRDGRFTAEWTGTSGVEPGAWLARSSAEEVAFILETGELIRRRAGGEWRRLRPPTGAFSALSAAGPEGSLWIRSADQVLWRVLGDECQRIDWRRGLSGSAMNHLTTDTQGRMWIGTERELAVWTGDRFRRQAPLDGGPPQNVSYVGFTRRGDAWVIADGHPRKWTGDHWASNRAAAVDVPGYYRLVLTSIEDHDGHVWFAHYGRGLVRLDREGHVLQITANDGLPGDRIRCLLEDREGNLWVGIDRGGLARLRKRPFRVLSEAEGLSAKAAVSICEDRSRAVWIGTLGGGLDRWRDGAFTHFKLPTGASGGFVFSVFPDLRTDRLWMSADREDLFVFEQGHIRPAPWSTHGIKAILVDKRGRVWLGTKNGLSCRAGGVTRAFGPQDGFDRQDVRALAEDGKGAIWIGAGDGTVYRFSEDRLTAFRPQDPESRNAVWSLLADADGTVWVGTFRGGLLRLRDGVFTRYSTREGLPSNVICQILDDDQGRLWAGTHAGVFRVAKDALHAFARREIDSLPVLVFGRSDGLPTLECSGNYQPSCWRGHDGRLWFSTTKGVVSVQPRDVTEIRVPPPVVIEEILVDGELRATHGGEGPVRVQPGEQRVEIHYTGLSLTTPESTRFRYRLQGLEDSWFEARGRRVAQYSYLRPGSYRFHVIAANRDGVWNEGGAQVTLIVLPHYFETWWFGALMTLGGLGLVAGAVRYVSTRRLHARVEHLERLRAIERERARIAKDIHDDLGAALTQITLLSELARNEAPQEADLHLAQISDTARELTRTMDEIVWAINPRNDTLDSLTTYICQFAQEYLNLAGIQCRLEVPTQLPTLPLRTEVRHNLFLAVKETLHNVVKHAQATEVRLRLAVGLNELALSIQDDGRGFDPESPASAGVDRVASGLGLDNLEKRLASLGGRCIVETAPGRGTTVELRVGLQ